MGNISVSCDGSRTHKLESCFIQRYKSSLAFHRLSEFPEVLGNITCNTKNMTHMANTKASNPLIATMHEGHFLPKYGDIVFYGGLSDY